MSHRLPLPIQLTGAPFRSRELDALGVPRKRLEASDVDGPFHGVHTMSPLTTPIERAEALATVMQDGDAFSHMTAAVLVGAPLPRLRDSRLHVTSVGGERRIRRPGVVGHRTADIPITMHLGLPIVEPAHVFTQLAGLLRHDDLVAVGDYLVTPNRRQRTAAIASKEALMAAIPERARGAGRARRALADVRVGAESRMESLLRLLLVRAGLPEPLLNPAMLIEGRVLHPDLAYPQFRVVIEYEGDEHRTDLRRWRADIARREAFESAGERVIRVHVGDVLTEPEQFLARVCRILAQRRPA